MRIFKVPVGNSPNEQGGEPGPAVVIARGTNYNLWIDHTDTVTGYEELDEGRAMVWALQENPGTPLEKEVNMLDQELSKRFGINLAQEDAPAGSNAPNLKQYLLDQPSRKRGAEFSNGRPARREFWDVEQWNTPAGKDPKRTPIPEKAREENPGLDDNPRKDHEPPGQQ